MIWSAPRLGCNDVLLPVFIARLMYTFNLSLLELCCKRRWCNWIFRKKSFSINTCPTAKLRHKVLDVSLRAFWFKDDVASCKRKGYFCLPWERRPCRVLISQLCHHGFWCQNNYVKLSLKWKPYERENIWTHTQHAAHLFNLLHFLHLPDNHSLQEVLVWSHLVLWLEAELVRDLSWVSFQGQN